MSSCVRLSSMGKGVTNNLILSHRSWIQKEKLLHDPDLQKNRTCRMVQEWSVAPYKKSGSPLKTVSFSANAVEPVYILLLWYLNTNLWGTRKKPAYISVVVPIRIENKSGGQQKRVLFSNSLLYHWRYRKGLSILKTIS